MQSTDIRFTLYPVGFIISAVFLAATLAAGWLLPTSHHVLHWRCQTHHVACLMLGDILMAIIQLAGDSLHDGSCKAVGESFPAYYCLVNFFTVAFLSLLPESAESRRNYGNFKSRYSRQAHGEEREMQTLALVTFPRRLSQSAVG